MAVAVGGLRAKHGPVRVLAGGAACVEVAVEQGMRRAMQKKSAATASSIVYSI